MVGLTKHIVTIELFSNLEDPLIIRPRYDLHIIELSALFHDIGNHKYTVIGLDPKIEVKRLFIEFGAEQSLAHSIQSIVNAVSFSYEVINLEIIQTMLAKYFELGIIQDVDRLDAISAIKIKRLFIFGAAKKRQF